MDIHAAASFVVPRGKHRNSFLCNVALADPAYLESIADGTSAECRTGTDFHEAVRVVVDQMRANAEADILAGRTLDPHLERLAVAELRSDGGILGGGNGVKGAGAGGKAPSKGTAAKATTAAGPVLFGD